MSQQQVDPDEWEQDIEKAERRLTDRRVAERRRRDRFGRWFERAALLVLVILYIVGFVSADHQRNDLKAQQERTARQARQIAKNTAETNRNRREVVGIVCHAINHDRKVLRVLIVGGTKGTKPFERVYRQFGFPPYKERLLTAQKAAGKLAPLGCTALVSSTKPK